MNRLIFIIVFSLIPFAFITNTVYAHGVVYEVKEDKTIIIKVEYDDGEPMSYAQVKIFSPTEKEIEHQNGRTDRNGCFAFLPDVAGEWKITVNDGMGHGVMEKVKVKEAMVIEPIHAVHRSWTRFQKLIVGISIVWGLAGVICYFKVRKKMT